MLFALWRIRPDVTVMCNATQTLLALPIKWLSVGRLALIVEDTSHAMRNLGFLKRWTKGWLYRRVDCCFAFSEDAINYLAQVGIVHGVKRSSWSLDMNSFRPRSFEGLSQAGARETKSEKTIIFIGQLIQRKGVMLLLQAWLELSHETRQRCKLLLVGDGYMRTEMQEFINNHDLNNVNILGHIPYNKVKYLLSSADLLVLPTLEDLFSLTVVEAMASGCAVITTPFAGARELINIEETGWIVDPTVPEALTKTLQHALSEQTDLRRMGLAARARVEEMDNIKVMAEFAQALRQLAGAA
jgi:glycosyltransferase involved in cell wall biosynthesis